MHTEGISIGFTSVICETSVHAPIGARPRSFTVRCYLLFLLENLFIFVTLSFSADIFCVVAPVDTYPYASVPAAVITGANIIPNTTKEYHNNDNTYIYEKTFNHYDLCFGVHLFMPERRK